MGVVELEMTDKLALELIDPEPAAAVEDVKTAEKDDEDVGNFIGCSGEVMKIDTQ